MDYMIAKVKQRQQPKRYKVFSEKRVFNFQVSNLSCIPYSPDHNLDEDSWFVIENFTSQTFCPEWIKEPPLSTEYNELPNSLYKKIAYLCSFESGLACFQKITPSVYINRRIISLGDPVELVEKGDKIFINSYPDAVYIIENNTLIFRNIATISSIFKGIDQLYKVATQEDVISFLDNDFIALKNDYSADSVGTANRKRIALAMESLDKLGKQDKREIISYIHEYCPEIVYDPSNESFEISSEAELKTLLYGIEQRFYTTQVGEEKRLANSIQILG